MRKRKKKKKEPEWARPWSFSANLIALCVPFLHVMSMCLLSILLFLALCWIFWLFPCHISDQSHSFYFLCCASLAHSFSYPNLDQSGQLLSLLGLLLWTDYVLFFMNSTTRFVLLFFIIEYVHNVHCTPYCIYRLWVLIFGLFSASWGFIFDRMRVILFFSKYKGALVLISAIKYSARECDGEICHSIVNVFVWCMTLWINRSFKSIYLRIEWPTFIKKLSKILENWCGQKEFAKMVFGQCVRMAPRFVLAVISICFVDILANASICY